MKMHLFPGIALAAFALTCAAADANRFEKDGVVVEFSAATTAASRTELMDGDSAEIKFRITDASGQPFSDAAAVT